jgi:hypothetical protein
MFADWINEVLEQVPFDLVSHEGPTWERGTVDFRTGDNSSHSWRSNEIASLRNKKLCHECNTGWMANLEGRSAPLLTPMILGRPHTLNADQQITAATWATKTVMVLETAMGDASPESHFPPDQRKTVMEEDRPPGLVRVRSAALEGLLAPLRYGCCRLLVQRQGVDFCQLHLYTLQINMLVIQVIRPDPPPPNYGALKEIAVPDDIEVPLFPPTVGGFFWPPEKSLSPDGLISYITRTEKPPPLPGS